MNTLSVIGSWRQRNFHPGNRPLPDAERPRQIRPTPILSHLFESIDKEAVRYAHGGGADLPAPIEHLDVRETRFSTHHALCHVVSPTELLRGQVLLTAVTRDACGNPVSQIVNPERIRVVYLPGTLDSDLAVIAEGKLLPAMPAVPVVLVVNVVQV